MKRNILLVTLITIFLLSSCAAGHNTSEDIAATDGSIAGFWLGLWHGIISPITFLISLFNDNVNLYEVHNNGGWYNFGFALGAGIILGGGGRVSGKKKK